MLPWSFEHRKSEEERTGMLRLSWRPGICMKHLVFGASLNFSGPTSQMSIIYHHCYPSFCMLIWIYLVCRLYIFPLFPIVLLPFPCYYYTVYMYCHAILLMHILQLSRRRVSLPSAVAHTAPWRLGMFLKFGCTDELCVVAALHQTSSCFPSRSFSLRVTVMQIVLYLTVRGSSQWQCPFC